MTLNDTGMNPAFKPVTFQNPFPSPPVVVALATIEGVEPAALRVRNVTQTGFEILQVEPPNEGGLHAAMTVDYIAAEIGQHTLPSGEQVVVGVHTTSSTVSSTRTTGDFEYDTVNFGTTIIGGSAVIAGIQTLNSEMAAIPSAPSTPWLTTSVLNAGATSFEVSLERSEVAAGTVIDETIGYIAFPHAGAGSFPDTSGNTVNWSAMISPAVIVGFDDTCEVVTFSATSFSDAHVVATKATRNGQDGGWLRRCSFSGTQIGLQIDEDTALSAARTHSGAESAGLIAFSEGFHAFLGGVLEADKTVEMIEDPAGNTTDVFSIPGSVAQYSIEIRNVGFGGVDEGSLVLVDSIPNGLALVVSDFGAPASGPLSFVDDSPASGLIYNFTSLGDLMDSIDFSSNNGASFDYVPLPTANGTDPNITDFRFNPSGVFRGDTTSAVPTITIRYKAVVR